MFKVKMLPFFNAETDEGGSGVNVTSDEQENDVPDAGEQNETEETETEVSSETEDDLPELPPEQKTAFQKRLEREQKKMEEKLRTELEQNYKGQYSKHDQIIQLLGGDVEVIERAIKEQQWAQEADTYGYDREAYVREKQREDRLFELEIRDQINELRDNPDYAGIQGLKKDISDKVKRSNGALTVQEAYWALGGKSRAEQLKREVEQRELAKRTQAKRTVQSDSATSTTGLKPLSADLEAQRKRLGLSREEAEELLSNEFQNIDDYRKAKQKKRS